MNRLLASTLFGMTTSRPSMVTRCTARQFASRTLPVNPVTVSIQSPMENGCSMLSASPEKTSAIIR